MLAAWNMWGEGGEVYKKIVTFYLTDFGIEHQKFSEDIFYTFLQQ